jgi:ribonuclease E
MSEPTRTPAPTDSDTSSAEEGSESASDAPVRRRRIVGADRSATESPSAPAAKDSSEASAPPAEESKKSSSGPRRTRTLGSAASPSQPSADQPARAEKPERAQKAQNAEKTERAGKPQGRSAQSAEGAKESPGPTRRRSRKAPGAEAKSAEPAAQAASPPPAVAPPMVPPPARKPQIGDSRPVAAAQESDEPQAREGDGGGRKRRRRGGRGRGKGGSGGGGGNAGGQKQSNGNQQRQRRSGEPVEAIITDEAPVELDEAALEQRRGKERKGRPIGRYLMCVHVHNGVTHIAVLEGRSLIEHYVSRPSDDVSEIHGNIYLGKVQNVLPGMEAAFVDISTPKNAVLYRGDVTYDLDDVDGDKSQPPQPKAKKGRGRLGRRRNEPRIEDLLKARQTILCQVTKNPISHKGARLSTEVSLPGRFVVLVPNSPTYGISKRLPDKERKRLRNILDKVKPKQHGVIVRTAAENVTAEEIERDVRRLLDQWDQINQLAQKSKAPSLLFREPELAVRIIREEFNKDYRGIVIDDPKLYEQVKGYMETIAPALADRIQYHDPSAESLPLFERYHVAEQLRKAVDRKVWLPSGGSLIIEHTEALTVIDVNTGKNVGKSNLEETVFRNNLEAAEEIAKQLRLRDIGGIIVIDFIDMEIKRNRDELVRVFDAALERDKTRTQISNVSDLGLIEMTRKRIGEGLLESVSHICDHCEGRGVQLREDLLDV